MTLDRQNHIENANPSPFQFLFTESIPEPGLDPAFDPTALASRIAGRSRPTGKRDKILVLNTIGGADAHAEALVAELMARGVRPYYLLWHEMLRASRFDLALGDNAQTMGRIELPMGELVLDEVQSVWCRSPWTEPVKTELEGDAENFTQREVDAVFNGIAGLLSHAFWVNHPNAVYAAEDKLLQLKLARELGMTIPRTLVTNDPTRAREFFDACHGEMIVKTFRRPRLGAPPPKHWMYTERVTREHLAHMDSVRYAPCLFQEYVPKEFELRVTIVGSRVFAAEIHSQQSPVSHDDYRHYDLKNTPYYPHTLPPAFERACLELARRFNVAYAALDLIRRPDGEYVFLEINANAQYLWIEDLTGLPIREALAEMLIYGSSDE